MNSLKLHYKEQEWFAWRSNLDMRINKWSFGREVGDGMIILKWM
jgi:hypothetical protein